MASPRMPQEQMQYTLQHYLKVNDYVKLSEEKLKMVERVANKAIISQGLILNNCLREYLELMMSNASLKNSSIAEGVKACAEVFDVNHDVVTIIELEINSENPEVLDKIMHRQELVKYVENVQKRVEMPKEVISAAVELHELKEANRKDDAVWKCQTGYNKFSECTHFCLFVSIL